MTYIASIVQAWQRQLHDAPQAGTVMVDAADLAAVLSKVQIDAHEVPEGRAGLNRTSHVCTNGECQVWHNGQKIHTIPLDADFRLEQAKAERG